MPSRISDFISLHILVNIHYSFLRNSQFISAHMCLKLLHLSDYLFWLTKKFQFPLHYYYYYYYYYYYTIWMSLVTGLFCLILLLNQQRSPLVRLQVSHCSTSRIACNIPCIAVFCSESIECFPGTASKFFLRLLVTIPVAPIVTGIIVHFRFHIRCISLILLLLLLLFPKYHWQFLQ